ncbi:uncharacterized protein RAG0_08315 [Rhynchosporium agropyri]|uniref:NAD(P)-binding domain-containing protein n=1 Tax=Rhynchosporium agropyri TaxID=914238 RepID=A0A1E1KQA2_9HELO|nr:uncharacterized protein RAG0_08315 [Rhynchosporium agropyri]
MRVLLLGATGNVGSRLLPALLAHHHHVVVYVRNPAKLSLEAKSKCKAIVVGSATDSAAIKSAILTHKIDAVVNAAGVAAMTGFTAQGDFGAIFENVVRGVREAVEERGNGVPIRFWGMSGFAVLDHPRRPFMIGDYIPLFPAHKLNYQLIKSQPSEAIAWSLFCASTMNPKHDTPQFPPSPDCSPDKLIASVDAPPSWTEKFRAVPLIGDYLNVMAQVGEYTAVLENCVDFIAADLERGLESGLVRKRVGVQEKEKGKAS